MAFLVGDGSRDDELVGKGLSLRTRESQGSGDGVYQQHDARPPADPT
jgi:hypothetical protein